MNSGAYSGRPRQEYTHRGIRIVPVCRSGASVKWHVLDPRDDTRPYCARTLEEARLTAAEVADRLQAEQDGDA